MRELSGQRNTGGTVVCLGYFDGVHLGHQALLRAGREVADQLGLPLVVHTFDRAPCKSGAALTDLTERIRLLKAYGADEVCVSVFDDAMRLTPGEVFFRDTVIGKLHARHVVCGEGHRFGYEGKCGLETLRALCAESGTGLTAVSKVTLEGMHISSTAVREALAQGDTALAEKLLGRKPGAACAASDTHIIGNRPQP